MSELFRGFILYFCSGQHVAPLELVAQILSRTSYAHANVTFTEIDPEYLDGITRALQGLSHRGFNVTEPRLGRETKTHAEYVFDISLQIRPGTLKTIKLTFVLGKKDENGGYPPYFRQKEDFDPADIVIAFDAEDMTLTENSIRQALRQGEKKKYLSWRIVITEDWHGKSVGGSGVAGFLNTLDVKPGNKTTTAWG